MSSYDHKKIEEKWQGYWNDMNTYQTEVDVNKPKYYVLDMFPYPSGAGLHVGHPLGYIASDIVSRYKKLKGFNVLHPMGFDSFGLPAEQYAIETGQHPAKTTEENIKTFKKQLFKIGFSYDWSKEIRTSDPGFYKWTQWIFIQLFNSWYNKESGKAESIGLLIKIFEKEGNKNIKAECDEGTPHFTAEEWSSYSKKEKDGILLKYRLTYLADAVVNWCPELGTVLANDEVKDGFSERGGYPVERKKMKQWMMRITAYADRLLSNLDTLEWSDSLKEMQRNWIGKSNGCEINFAVEGKDTILTAFTTRPDTIFGVTYLVIAPEHELVQELVTEAQKESVSEYLEIAKNRSERERMSDVKQVSGVFTGSYVVNPFNGKRIPLWVADYVLAGYGTGVVMAVPSSDDRDFKFATHFDLPIINVIDGTEGMEDPTEKKHGIMINSGFLDGLESTDAIEAAIKEAETKGIGKRKINYKIRDAVFSRQRYWGEPVPVYFDENDFPQPVSEEDLPVTLPEISEYKPTSDGKPPLGRAEDWLYQDKYPFELTTMPGWAGSSWYFLRYMDSNNEKDFVDKDVVKYWNAVDFYLGGTEHATGHLLYSRFWNMFLYDRGFIFHEEPFKKLVNQGMIQGRSNLIYKVKGEDKFVTHSKKDQYEVSEIHIDIQLADKDILDIEKFKQWRPEYTNSEFVLNDEGKFECGHLVEKMSKSKYNVVNPDHVVDKYGADTLRMYEMFLGPIEQSKPWNTHGIDGVSKFLKKLWRLFYNDSGTLSISEDNPSNEELKVLHKTIKKIEEDIESLSLNTSISAFMVCVNELTSLKCHKKEILESLLIILSSFAPHICEELWHALGNKDSICNASFPKWDNSYLVESMLEYPISINGKVRTKMTFSADYAVENIEADVVKNEIVQKWVEGKSIRKVIVVPKRIVNVVIG